MHRVTLILVLTMTVLLGSSGVCWSADFQKGLDAVERGDYATAVKEWTPLAEQGDAPAQVYLGQMYERGLGVSQDYKTAVKWYTLAAEQGLAIAQYNLGVMYDKGEGVPLNYTTALREWKPLAEQGDASAQTNLGQMYDQGKVF